MKKVLAHNIDELFVATSISANFLGVSMLNLEEKKVLSLTVSKGKKTPSEKELEKMLQFTFPQSGPVVPLEENSNDDFSFERRLRIG